MYVQPYYLYAMKMLYVIRHAKSSWSEPGLDDFDRPLNDRGQSDAPEMARRMKAKGIQPDLIITSTAERARKTAGIFADVLGYPSEAIVLKPDLYETDIDTVFDVVHQIDPQASHVFIFGHNPTFTYFVNDLASARIDNIPTCGIAAIALNGDWQEAEEDSGSLVWFDYPKNK
jgi:phosphohistidine phosphatase